MKKKVKHRAASSRSKRGSKKSSIVALVVSIVISLLLFFVFGLVLSPGGVYLFPFLGSSAKFVSKILAFATCIGLYYFFKRDYRAESRYILKGIIIVSILELVLLIFSSSRY